MKYKHIGKVDRPLIDKLADANVKEQVRKIEAEKPKEPTLQEKVKEVLAK